MSERTRIILGMSLIELDHFAQIGGVLPPLAAHRLSVARSRVEDLVRDYGADAALMHLPADHKFLIIGMLRQARVA